MTAGTGRGVITADGCAVELYRLLPPMGEAELVHAAVPAGATVLDLGCGTGRIATPLVRLGHEVVAVDASADMLACVEGAATVQAPIEGLDLGRTFDAVLLASHLVNTPDDAQRQAILAAAARHVAPGGRVIVEWHPPDWFERVVGGSVGHVGGVQIELTDASLDGDRLSATVRYRAGKDLWTQTFTARRLDDGARQRELRAAGLSFERWCRDDHSWFVAVPVG